MMKVLLIKMFGKRDGNRYKVELATEGYTRLENKIVNLYVNDILNLLLSN